MLVDKVESITTIGINRPDKRNCVNQATGELLKKAIENFENDPTSPAAVLYGTGGNLCAGYDLSELSSFDKNSGKLPLESETGHMVICYVIRLLDANHLLCRDRQDVLLKNQW